MLGNYHKQVTQLVSTWFSLWEPMGIKHNGTQINNQLINSQPNEN
jgi:hypothetical protein